MTLATLIVFLYVGLYVATNVLWGFILYLGLLWAKVENVTKLRVASITVLVIVIQTAATIALRNAAPSAFVLLGLQAIVAVLVPCVVIAVIAKATFFRAMQAWLPTLMASGIALAFLLLVVRPYVSEMFVVTANAMAPTLIGEHLQGTCPTCGGPAYGSPMPRADRSIIPLLMICRDHFHTTEPTDPDDQVIHADRVVVAKFVEPRRWDMVVFRVPDEPTVLYAMRLVGLPGEEITIRQGRVLADGKELTPPDGIRELRYTVDDFNIAPKQSGSPENPAKLGPGEYFVLGDFSARSRDSRWWSHGAPGHPAYAVPESNMIGVVTQIYWPPSRWRSFR